MFALLITESEGHHPSPAMPESKGNHVPDFRTCAGKSWVRCWKKQLLHLAELLLFFYDVVHFGKSEGERGSYP
jgi:hypothetical protein